MLIRICIISIIDLHVVVRVWSISSRVKYVICNTMVQLMRNNGGIIIWITTRNVLGVNVINKQAFLLTSKQMATVDLSMTPKQDLMIRRILLTLWDVRCLDRYFKNRYLQGLNNTITMTHTISHSFFVFESYLGIYEKNIFDLLKLFTLEEGFHYSHTVFISFICFHYTWSCEISLKRLPLVSLHLPPFCLFLSFLFMYSDYLSSCSFLL